MSSLRALLALVVLAILPVAELLVPPAWQAGLLIAYLVFGALGAIISLNGIFTAIVRGNKWGTQLRHGLPFLLRDRDSFVVAASLLLYLVCYVPNQAAFWVVLFAAGIWHGDSPAQQVSYATLERRAASPGFFTDRFLFPTATVACATGLYLAPYFGAASLPYTLVAAVLWGLTLLRMISYLDPLDSPAHESVPTTLRRRYSRPKLMFALLLVAEGLALVLLVPLLTISANPRLVTLHQFANMLSTLLRPGDWIDVLELPRWSAEAIVPRISGILFGAALLGYLWKLLRPLVGRSDHFKVTDDDRVQMAFGALRAREIARAKELLTQILIDTPRSYEVRAFADLAESDVDAAAEKIRMKRRLLQRKEGDPAVFHELLLHVRNLGAVPEATEERVFGWAIRNGIQDEDIAIEVAHTAPGAEGELLTDEMVRLARALDPAANVSIVDAPPATAVAEAIRRISTERPMAAAMLMMFLRPLFPAGLPGGMPDAIRAVLQCERRNAADLREVIVLGFFSKQPTYERLRDLTSVLEQLIAQGCDEDELFLAFTPAIPIARRTPQVDEIDPLRGSELTDVANRWRAIIEAVKENPRLGIQSQLAAEEIQREIAQAAARANRAQVRKEADSRAA